VTYYVLNRREAIEQSCRPTFALHKDNWNDFGFMSQYTLMYYGNKVTDDMLIGSLKIIKIGQRESTRSHLEDDFSELDDSYCSMGLSLE
jgi:hypothetical protein